MRKFLFVSWLIYFLGLALKFFHLPGSFVLLLGSLFLLFHSLVFTFKNFKTDLSTILSNWSGAVFSVYLLFRLLFWQYAQIIFWLSILLFLFAIQLQIRQKRAKKYGSIFLALFCCFTIYLSNIRAHQVFYFIHIRPILNNSFQNPYDNYSTWDKYSWFLYLANHQDEALEANQKAIELVRLVIIEAPSANELKSDLAMLEKHRNQIKNRTWNSY